MSRQDEQTQFQIDGAQQHVVISDPGGVDEHPTETCHNYKCEHFGSPEFVVPREEENTRHVCLSCGWLF